MAPHPSPIKERARAHELDVLQPEKARAPWLLERVRALSSDVAVVVAYGSLLPAALLDVPPLGFVNVHFSLLPAYRGAAPVQHALVDGRKETGVSIMVLTEGMDEGPVLATRAVDISDDDTAGELGDRLARVGAELLVPTLLAYAAREIEPVPQDHERATYAPKMTPEKARIDWTAGAEPIRNLVRALNPVPGAWTSYRGARVKVHRAALTETRALAAGEIGPGRELVVGTGDAAVALVEVQAAGKRKMIGEELRRGLRPSPGDRFE